MRDLGRLERGLSVQLVRAHRKGASLDATGSRWADLAARNGRDAHMVSKCHHQAMSIALRNALK
eukprot:8903243-Pyramimonas_sp.AAC.1